MSLAIEKSLEKNKDLLKHIGLEIWKHPELCYEEIYAHDLLTSTLEEFGFAVQKHYFIPTAFRAEYNSGRGGPTVATVCEYDALPGIGHACGHNLIAEIGIGAAIAVKEAMEDDVTIGGKIVVFGTPAEEGGGGKIKLINEGAFEDVDAVMMAHPQSVNRLYPLIVESASMSVTFTANPDDFWQGPSAVDGAIACYNNISLIRRHLKEKWRVSMIIPKSNCKESKMELIYRAPAQSELHILKEKLELCIKTAAEATNCTYQTTSTRDMASAYRGLLYNTAMTETFGKHANALGVKFYDKDPRFVESAVSSDIGNVSQVVPAMQPEFDIGALPPHVNHTPGFADVAASDKAQEYTFTIMKALAKTALDLLSDPDLMMKTKIEFNKNSAKDHVSRKAVR